MKKSKIIFALFIALFLAKLSANAQFGIGLGYNYTRYMGDFAQGNSGLNFKAFYNISEKGTINGGFVYGFPIKYPTTTSAISKNMGSTDWTDGQLSMPPMINVESELQMSFKTFYLNYNHFFVNDNEEPFGIYALLGAALINVGFETKVTGSYDKNLYTLEEQGEIESVMGFMIHAGIGAQYNFGSLALFGEGVLGIPANRVGNAEVEITVPFNAGLNIGTKYTFGSDGGSSGKSKGKGSKSKKRKSKKRRR